MTTTTDSSTSRQDTPSTRREGWRDLGDRVACLALIVAVGAACVLALQFLNAMPSPR